MKKHILIIVVISLISCGSNHDSSDYYYVMQPSGEKNVIIENLEIEAIKLDPIESSLIGFITIQNDSIHFIDERFGWAFVFDADGRYHDRRLGQGFGPSELPMTGIQFHTQTPDGKHVFIGSSFDVNIFDSNYQRLNSTLIRWKRDKPQDYLQRNPTPEDQRSYELAYQVGNIRADDNFVYLPLFSAGPGDSDYNFSTDLFASNARIIAAMNIETTEVERIFGRLSPIFSENKNARIFSFTHFDLLPDNRLAVTFGPDSLIYIFDKNFKQLKSFGIKGRYMDTEYNEIPNNSTPSELRRYFINGMTNKGYYTSLSCFPEYDLCFRGYTRGKDFISDGLQIYKGNTLIADVDTPIKGDPRMFNFYRIEGVIDSWFYSNVFVDEIAEEMTVFRFKLKDEVLK